MTEQPASAALTSRIYDAIDAFQRTAQLSGLQHAQMRQHLAEHLAAALAGTDRSAVLRDLIDKAEEWDGHITVQELRRMADEAEAAS